MRRLATLVLLVFSCSLFAQTLVRTEPDPLNSAKAQHAHYVVMVSLDGFRYDYPTLHGAPNLLALGARGASTPEGMYPSFRSITFPNHYALASGLRPQHSGIVNNMFYDPATKRDFSYKNASGSDGSFFSGTPLWALAVEQGMRSASYYWPSISAKIDGHHPTYYTDHYTDKTEGHATVDAAVEWLKLPEAERPHLIMLYFSDTDHSGHDFGPDSEETRKAVHHVDDLVGELDHRIQELHLPVDLIVTADHGMAKVEGEPLILSEVPSVAAISQGLIHSGFLLYSKDDAQAQALTDAINGLHDPRVTAYRRSQSPLNLHLRDNPREGDPVLVASKAFDIRWDPYTGTGHPNKGDHGYDAHTMPEMKAIFFAAGPDIRPGVQLKSFENVDVYDFVAHILKLKPAKNDGSLTPMKTALKR